MAAKGLKNRINVDPLAGDGHAVFSGARQAQVPLPVAIVNFGALVDALNYGRASKSMVFWVGKRSFDVFLSLALLLVCLPVLLLITLAISVESRGNPLFLQYRVGERMRLFRIFKFRTMYHGAADEALMVRDDASGRLRRPTYQEDGRITRMGRFLRRWSFDELPQLVNVLLGQMSMVGPRPLTVIESTQIPVEALLRYSVPAGITGLGQIRDRSIIFTPDRFDHDRDYVLHLGLEQEWHIVKSTFGTVLRGQ